LDVEERIRRTEEFSTIHSRTVTAYIFSYFQGLSLFSALKSYGLGGSELGIAFRPLLVTVLGLDFEKRGRIKLCSRNVTMKSSLETSFLYCDRRTFASSESWGVVHISRDVKQIAASSMSGSALLGGVG